LLGVCLAVVLLRGWLGRLRSVANSTALCKHQNRYDDAEKLLLEAVDGYRLRLGDKHPHTQQPMNNLIARAETDAV